MNKFLLVLILLFPFQIFADSDKPNILIPLEEQEQLNKKMNIQLEEIQKSSGSWIVITFKRDSKGNIIESKTIKNKSEIIIWKMIYDYRNRIKGLSFETNTGKVWTGLVFDGFQWKQLQVFMYNTQDKLVSGKMYDNENQLTYTESRKLDEKNRTIEQGKYDANSKLFSGSVLRKYTYDEKWNVIWEQYFWEDKKLKNVEYNIYFWKIFPSYDESAAHKYTYDAQWRLIEEHIYGTWGKLIDSTSYWVAIKKFVYDGDKVEYDFNSTGVLLSDKVLEKKNWIELPCIDNYDIWVWKLKWSIDKKIFSLSKEKQREWINTIIERLQVLENKKLSKKNLETITMLRRYLIGKKEELTILNSGTEIVPNEIIQ